MWVAEVVAVKGGSYRNTGYKVESKDSNAEHTPANPVQIQSLIYRGQARSRQGIKERAERGGVVKCGEVLAVQRRVADPRLAVELFRAPSFDHGLVTALCSSP